MAYDPILAMAANSRFNRLEEANRDADRPRAAGGAHRPAMRLHATPRALAAGGEADREAWQLADGGIGNATAYRTPSLGGWHWVAVLGPELIGHDGAVLLTIGPDGARFAERYGSEPEAWSDMEWIAAEAVDDRAAATPAQFAAILEPAAEPMAAMVAVEAEPVAEPVAVAVDLQPVALPAGRRGLRGWLLRQLDAMLDPWAGGAWRDYLPVIVAAADLKSEADLEPEPSAAPSQPGRVRGWVAAQVAAMVNPWLGGEFGWPGPRPSAETTG